MDVKPEVNSGATEEKHNRPPPVIDAPTNPMVTPLLNDLYQFTMAYAYWKAGNHKERVVLVSQFLCFHSIVLIYAICLFLDGIDYTGFRAYLTYIFGDLTYIFGKIPLVEEIAFVRETLSPACEDALFDYLEGIDCSDVEVYAITEGSVVFPKIPLMRVEGPVAVVQLLETPDVNLINYASLVTTNAARHRFVAGKSKLLLEFGLRRGPDGGIGASRYCYIGGFDATRHLSKLEILKRNGKGPESIIHYKEAEGFFWININIQEAHLTDQLSNVDCCWFTIAKVVHLQLISTRKKERGKWKNLHLYRVTKRLIVQTSVLKNK
ncbi:unnamed protein product [Lactuca virosa]|uniref:nicotinate phosphoribosyltransferase n=1 Tax=Lactuca virosa TaxID=75947 RepID=A0AAU9PQE4_9ASTR|nr:unnamed protein product [Lactuca virosa]